MSLERMQTLRGGGRGSKPTNKISFSSTNHSCLCVCVSILFVFVFHFCCCSRRVSVRHFNSTSVWPKLACSLWLRQVTFEKVNLSPPELTLPRARSLALCHFPPFWVHLQFNLINFCFFSPKKRRRRLSNRYNFLLLLSSEESFLKK